MRYFAYGSNLYRTQLRKRAPSARFVATGALPGWRLTFGGWSRAWGGAVANIVKDEASRVLGAVYDITDPGDVRALDAYEGCPVVYQCRRVTPVRLEGCRRLRCWTYVMGNGKPPGYPSDQYAKTIANGLREHGLTTDHLIDALAVASTFRDDARARLAKEKREDAANAALASERIREGQREWERIVRQNTPSTPHETRPRFASTYDDDNQRDDETQDEYEQRVFGFVGDAPADDEDGNDGDEGTIQW